MTALNKQALREAAEKATPGPWEMEHENIWFRDTKGYTKHLMYAYQGDDVDDQQDHDNTAYIAAFNPKVVLALLDEMESADGYASAYEAEKWHYHGLAESEGERAERAEKECKQLLEKLSERTEQCKQLASSLEAAEKRIAELDSQRQMAFMACNRWADKCREAESKLEARTVSVKLPNQTDFDDPLSAYEAIAKCREAFAKSCTDAGIKLDVGE